MEQARNIMKRTVKDSVFCDLFSEPKYLLKLYQALHPEDTETTVDDIKDVSLRNVLVNAQFNDVGFRIKDRVLLLLEEQTKWSSNIIIRILMYLMQTYNDYCTENGLDLYSEKKVKLPRPELYVIHPGERKSIPEYITLKDEFFDGQDIAVDARVRVICEGEPGDIINQYIAFAKVADDQKRLHGPTQKAVEETIRICTGQDILREYLNERQVEVMDIMTALFDQDVVTARHEQALVREASQEASKEASKEIALKMLAEGDMTEEKIARLTGLSVEEVMKLRELQPV